MKLPTSPLTQCLAAAVWLVVCAASATEAEEAAVPADLRQPYLRSGDEPGDIIRVLLTGLNGTPMVSFAETLTAEQKCEVAAYILALRRDFEKAAPVPGK